MFIKTIFNYLLKRFSEPSSYAGLTGLLVGAHVTNPDIISAKMAMILSGICGIVSVVLGEKAEG